MEENDWLTRIRSGDDSALQEVYFQYQEEFLFWIRKINDLSVEESQEVYHMTMLAFYENIKGGKLKELSSQLKTYIFGIGKNKAKEFKRLYKAKAVSLDGIAGEFAQEEISDDFNNKSLLILLKKGLENLGDPCKSLLEAFYLEGLSMNEISETFHYKSASVAKTQKYKCIQRLKKNILS